MGIGQSGPVTSINFRSQRFLEGFCSLDQDVFLLFMTILLCNFIVFNGVPLRFNSYICTLSAVF